MDSSTVSPRATTILDLNDDCLIEVCRHMSLRDLCTVADVCDRFRSSAQAYFATAEHGKISILSTIYRGDLLENDLVRVSRIFGVSMFRIVATQAVNHPVLVTLLKHFCRDNLVDMVFRSCEATTRVAIVLKNSGTLHFHGCSFDNLMHEMLPQWTSHFLELELFFAQTHGQIWFRYFQLPCPKLTKLSFNYRGPMCFEFLKLNSQLKELVLFERLHPDDHMLQFIAEHLTRIQHLRFELEGDFNLSDFKYLGDMSNLSSLEMNFDCHFHDTVSAIRQLGETNILLKRLKLSVRDGAKLFTKVHLNDFVVAVCRFEELEALTIEIQCNEHGLNATHLNYMCKHLTQLKELDLITSKVLTATNILECVRNAENLESLKLRQLRERNHKISLNVGFFKKMVTILEKRPGQQYLSIQLGGVGYTDNIPNDLAGEKGDILSISIKE